MVRFFNQNFGIKCSTDKCAILTMNKGKEETIQLYKPPIKLSRHTMKGVAANTMSFYKEIPPNRKTQSKNISEEQ